MLLTIRIVSLLLAVFILMRALGPGFTIHLSELPDYIAAALLLSGALMLGRRPLAIRLLTGAHFFAMAIFMAKVSALLASSASVNLISLAGLIVTVLCGAILVRQPPR